METVSDFILGGSKITADGDCSHEIKRRLLLRRKVMTNLDNTSTIDCPSGPSLKDVDYLKSESLSSTVKKDLNI